ncbi:MAG: metallophosphoesterase [Methanobacteriaceae archaeon]
MNNHSTINSNNKGNDNKSNSQSSNSDNNINDSNYYLMDNIKIIDLAIEINDYNDKYLIISDLHIGYEYALNKQGFMIPKFQFKKIIAKLELIIANSDANKIIVNGDLKHEFGKISKQEWKETEEFINFLEEHFEEIIIIKGNHDNFTEFILKQHNLNIYDNYSINIKNNKNKITESKIAEPINILILHGHRLNKEIKNNISANYDYVIIGHEHPSIGIRNCERVEKVKCFLNGVFNIGSSEKQLIVMPSFNFLAEGSDILVEKTLSPFLKESNINEFEVLAVEESEIFNFGKVKDIINFNNEFNKGFNRL